MSLELTTTEMRKLDELEAVIDRGIKTFTQVGTALMAIRDAKLYRTEYATFEAYCQERWQITRMRASQLISAVEVVENVNHGLQIAPPDSERQARPLAKLPAAEQPAAWQAATDKAESEGRKVTAKDVENEVRERTGKQKEVTHEEKHRDPTDTTVEVSDDEVDTPTLYQLKRFWRQATKREKTQFREWIA